MAKILSYIINKFDDDVSFCMPDSQVVDGKKTFYVPFFVNEIEDKLEYAFVVQKDLIDSDVELKITYQSKEGVIDYYNLEPVRQEDAILRVGHAGEQFLTMI